MTKITYTIITLIFSLVGVAQDIVLDPQFNPGGVEIAGSGTGINASCILPNGKMMIAGSFSAYNGTPVNKIARLNSDGTLDSTFNPGTGPDQAIRTIEVGSNGKIYIGGNFFFYNGVAKRGIARLNEDGGLDTSFNTAFYTSEMDEVDINDIELTSSGKLWIGGSFLCSNWSYSLARLNTNGSLDNTFISYLTPFDLVFSISIQQDNKILIGGWLGGGSEVVPAVRYNADGSWDEVFEDNLEVYGQSRLAFVQPDGKILVAGGVIALNSDEWTPEGVKQMVRINADGTTDTSFNAPHSIAATNNEIYDVDIYMDKILVSGLITDYDGVPVNNLALVNLDGTLDENFNTGTGFVNQASTLSPRVVGVEVLPGQKIMAVGMFTSYNNSEAGAVARLGSSDAMGIYESIENHGLVVYRANNLFFECSQDIVDRVIIHDALGRLVFAQNHINSNKFSPYIQPQNSMLLYTVFLKSGETRRGKVLY